ncbi:MAG: GTPase [Candidatus Pacearchaeota archaeon]|nr:GTPase [Candidatus Pacearchaeota archaeon]
MPINASYEYFEAEKKYLAAQTLEERIKCLEELIRKAPRHKGSENLLAELRLRLKKFREKSEKARKAGKGKKGIRKEGYQAALVGKTNSGKSSLLNKLTNANSKVSLTEYSTINPEVGIMDFEGVKIQVIDLPSINGRDFDSGIANNANCLLLVINNFEDLNDIEKVLEKTEGKRIIVFNKIDLLNENEIRKIDARFRSKRINFIFVSALTGWGVEDLKRKIFSETEMIRVFTKEPGKKKNEDPVVLKEGSSVKDVAETIYKGFSRRVKETRLTGPSGKFVNQRVGMNHKLKDMDVVEFKD